MVPFETSIFDTIIPSNISPIKLYLNITFSSMYGFLLQAVILDIPLKLFGVLLKTAI